MSSTIVASLVSGLALASATDVLLESFSSPAHKWAEKDDPVMGGQSSGTTTIADSMLHFNGTVRNVPSLSAPGFITSFSTDNKAWADVSHCNSLTMVMKSNTDYAGYRVSFGNAHAVVCKKFFAYGYKSPFKAPVGDFDSVTIPFANFSDCWDDATGNIITPCSQDKRFCPSASALRNIETISIWGEGVNGDIDLEVQSISGSDCQ